MFDVILSPEAQGFYSKADRPLALKLARCFQRLEQDPRAGNNAKRLSGDWSGYYRCRVGDWRVLYRVDDSQARVFVVVIAHRRDVYET